MSLAPTQTAPHPARYRWLILAVLFTARVVLAFQFQSLAAIGPVLVRSLAIDYGTLGRALVVRLREGR